MGIETIKNAPSTDFEAWEKYPKYNWVYCTGKLLSAQNIPWSVYKGDFCTQIQSVNYGEELIIADVSSMKTTKYFMEGFIFTRKLQGEHSSTYLAISKGEVKWEAQFNDASDAPLSEVCGDIKLKINAVLSLHFSKYNGIIRFDTIGKDIVSASLGLDHAMIKHFPEDWAKKVNRIYNNRPWGK